MAKKKPEKKPPLPFDLPLGIVTSFQVDELSDMAKETEANIYTLSNKQRVYIRTFNMRTMQYFSVEPSRAQKDRAEFEIIRRNNANTAVPKGNSKNVLSPPNWGKRSYNRAKPTYLPPSFAGGLGDGEEDT